MWVGLAQGMLRATGTVLAERNTKVMADRRGGIGLDGCAG